MKSLERNKKDFYYCKCLGEVDERDNDGYLTGEKAISYGEATMVSGVFSMTRGTSRMEMFGVDLNYDRVVTLEGDVDIDETSVLFVDKAPEYDADNNPLYDYIVKRVSKTLNFTFLAIARV